MIHALTLAYAPARILTSGLERFYETARLPDLAGFGFKHYLIDQHYPLERQETHKALVSAALRHGADLLDPGGNMGLHQGLNWACAQIRPAAGDLIVVYDPDSWPEVPGWLKAIAAGMTVGGYQILGLVDRRIHAELAERGIIRSCAVAGYLQVLEPVRDGIISVAGYAWDFLQAVGGFDEVLPYYGGLEASMWARLKAYGGRWGYLPQYTEDLDRLRNLQDKEFELYKWAHAHDRTFAGTFEAWLASGHGVQPKPLG